MTVSRVAVFCGVTLSLLAVSVTSAWAGDCANHNAKLDGLQADMKEYLGRLARPCWQNQATSAYRRSTLLICGEVLAQFRE